MSSNLTLKDHNFNRTKTGTTRKIRLDPGKERVNTKRGQSQELRCILQTFSAIGREITFNPPKDLYCSAN